MKSAVAHTFVATVEDRPGALNRVVSLFRRRGFNIASLTVGRTERPGVSRIALVVQADDDTARRVQANLEKRVDVLPVQDMPRGAPGASMDLEQKLSVARALQALSVDVVEAGFPAASPGDFDAVMAVARELEGPTVCALARANREDIDRVSEALRPAPRRRCHVFL